MSNNIEIIRHEQTEYLFTDIHAGVAQYLDYINLGWSNTLLIERGYLKVCQPPVVSTSSTNLTKEDIKDDLAMDAFENVNGLCIKANDDFTVDDSGAAFVSQRKLAEMIGVERVTIQKHIGRKYPDNIDISQGLSPELVQKVSTYYAMKGQPLAIEFIGVLAEAGAKAWIYTQAGYELKAEKPLSYEEMVVKVITESTLKIEQLDNQINLLQDKSYKEGDLLIRDICDRFNMTMTEMFTFLHSHKMIKKNDQGQWTSSAVGRYAFPQKIDKNGYSCVVVNSKGMKWLSKKL